MNLGLAQERQGIETSAGLPPRAPAATSWKEIVAPYKKPHVGKAGWQIINTVGSYASVWFLMYFSLGISWWLTLSLAVLAGGLLVRTFILFHDCGHGSLLPSRVVNDFFGCVTGLLASVPYYHWRGERAAHHGSTGQLDRRGVGREPSTRDRTFDGIPACCGFVDSISRGG